MKKQALDKIQELRVGIEKNTAEYQISKQLEEIIDKFPTAPTKIANTEKTLTDCNKAMKEYGKSRAKNGCFCMTDEIAEEQICIFFDIARTIGDNTTKKTNHPINIADLL